MQMRGLQVLKHHEKNFNLCANQHLSLLKNFQDSAGILAQGTGSDATQEKEKRIK